MAKFIKKVLKAGRYTVNTLDKNDPRKEEVFPPERLQHFAEQYNEMQEAGLKVPSPWSHDSNSPVLKESQLANSKNNAGWWKLFIDKDGDLAGEVDIPLKGDSSKIGTTVKEVSPLIRKRYIDGTGRVWDDIVTHVALVTHPIQPGQDEFKPIATNDEVAIAMSAYLGPIAGADTDDSAGPDKPQNDPGTDPKTMPNSGPYSVGNAIKCLRNSGIDLPDDTSEDNLIERICVACRAIKGNEAQNSQVDGSSEQGADGAEKQPQPIAMGGDMTADVQVLKQLETYKNLASVTAKASKIDRIKALIKDGKITSAYAKEHLEPLVEGFQLAINDEGTEIAGQLELAISLFEKLPAGASGSHNFIPPTAPNGQQTAPAAALSMFDEVVEHPAGLLGDTTLEGQELDDFVANQITQAGFGRR